MRTTREVSILSCDPSIDLVSFLPRGVVDKMGKVSSFHRRTVGERVDGVDKRHSDPNNDISIFWRGTPICHPGLQTISINEQVEGDAKVRPHDEDRSSGVVGP